MPGNKPSDNQPAISSSTKDTIIGAAVLGLILSGGLVGAAYVFKGNSTPAPVTPKVLAAAVPEEHRATIAKFFADFALVAETGEIETLGELRDAYPRAVRVLKEAKRLPDLPDFDEVLSKRLATLLGTDPGPVDAATLAAALRAVSQEIQ